MFGRKNKELNKENDKLKQENGELQQRIYGLLRNREINKDLYNTIKAILVTMGKTEIEIENKTIKEVEDKEIYVTESYLKFAKIIKIILVCCHFICLPFS